MLKRLVQPLQRHAAHQTNAWSRALSSSSYSPSAMELELTQRLKEQLQAEHCKVVDVSGGCGTMYDIEVVSPLFNGQSRVKQHRMVNQLLKKEYETMHGLTLKTWTPAQYNK